MKKTLLAVVVALFSINAMAQHEIGVVVGSLDGVSYKYWFNDALALQTDLAFGITKGAGNEYSQGKKQWDQTISASIWDFSIRPNVLYHWGLPANFKIYTGGGISFGMEKLMSITYKGYTYGIYGNSSYNKLYGKFGVNALVGASYDLQAIPLVFALDFRPGYGLGFRGKETVNGYEIAAHHFSYFDWSIAFAVRYRL